MYMYIVSLKASRNLQCMLGHAVYRFIGKKGGRLYDGTLYGTE
jgi:hypothetical protein